MTRQEMFEALEYNLGTAMVRSCADTMIREDSRFSQRNPKVQEP